MLPRIDHDGRPFLEAVLRGRERHGDLFRIGERVPWRVVVCHPELATRQARAILVPLLRLVSPEPVGPMPAGRLSVALTQASGVPLRWRAL